MKYMVMTRMLQALTLFWAVGSCSIFADNRIILYLKHAPSKVLEQAEQEALQSNLAQNIAAMQEKTPGQISQKIMKNALRSSLIPKLSGFVAIYGGYIDISDQDGLISFPLRHVTKKIYIAITPRINLVNIKDNTFSHREYVTQDQNPTIIYSLELKQDEKKYTYWDVQEVPIPDDKKINPITLVIITNPANIIIPQGQSITTQNIQFVLPNMYVTGRTNNEQALLTILDIKRYFEPINVEQKKASDLVVQKMVTNL